MRRTLGKRIKTKYTGVFYKQIVEEAIDDKGNITVKNVDKMYLVLYKSKGKLRSINIGKYSEGIRENYCKTKRDEFMLLERNGELPPQVAKRIKRDITTLDKLADIYFNDKEDTRSNKKQRGRYDLHIKPKLGHKDITELTRDDFKSIQKKLNDVGKAPKTVNGILALARAIINYSIKEKHLKLENPVSNIKPIKETKTGVRDRFLSIEEIKELINAVKNDADLYHFVRMALTTGARLEGVLNIKKKDIDIKHNTIRIKDFKNNSIYNGHFDKDDTKYISEVADKLANLKDSDFLINVPSRTIQRKLKPILDRLFNVGIETRDFQNRVVIHTLRHTFASHLAINGTPIFTIKELMNHGDIEMTMRYSKLSPSTGMKAVKGLYNV